VDEFLSKLADVSLFDMAPADLTPEEQAQDLVYEAYELPLAKAKKNIEKALKLDKTCLEAYEFLASKEKNIEKRFAILDKGIAIGREKFGGEFMKKFKGRFWGHHETRPFLRCLHAKARLFIYTGDIEESIEIFEEIIELNQNDNQGVRFPLLSLLIEWEDDKKFKKYDKMFAKDQSTEILYSRALYAFKNFGDNTAARKAAERAFKSNPFVVIFLLNNEHRPKKVDTYAFGSPEEASIYLDYAHVAWTEIEGAFEWLINTCMKLMDSLEFDTKSNTNSNKPQFLFQQV